jgi:sec-independent protein translocase protein TatA
MLGTLGTPELVFIFLLALLLFGPKKLPEIGRTVGKALTEFRRASNELKATFDREIKNLEAETGVKDVVNQYQYDTYNYDYSNYESPETPTLSEPSYGTETYDSAAATPSIESASAPEDAESPVAVAPEGTIAHNSETPGPDGEAGSFDGSQSETTTAAEHSA